MREVTQVRNTDFGETNINKANASIWCFIFNPGH